MNGKDTSDFDTRTRNWRLPMGSPVSLKFTRALKCWLGGFLEEMVLPSSIVGGITVRIYLTNRLPRNIALPILDSSKSGANASAGRSC